MNHKRREFLKTSTAATAAFLLSPLAGISEITPKSTGSKGFDLKILATLWGFKGDLESHCKKIKDEGYDGIETRLPAEEHKRASLFSALDKHKLDIAFICSASQSNWEQHLATFKTTVLEAAKSPQRPLFINCHSGRDYFSYEQNKAFIDYTTQLTEETAIPIYHETHRSRMLFAASVAKEYIEKNPDLRLTFDVSHWCNVSESFLQDQRDTVDLALQRVDHIHARVGHPQGPQVNDPRAPEWEEAVKYHFAWWDKIVERKKLKGECLTVLTEFGPPDYMPVLPYTREPMADQWAVNAYMMHLFRQRYR